MAHSFIAYIDEAGHEAGHKGEGSSEWFVMSAVVLRVECDEEVCSAVNEFRAALGKDDNWTFSYKEMLHKRCVLWSRIVATRPMRCVSIIVHKPSEPINVTNEEPIKLYRYVGKFLIERISWICRDLLHFSTQGDGKALLVFEERRRFPYQEFSDYLELLQNSGNPTRIDWNHIDPHLIEPRKHKDSRGCHIADAVAGATKMAIETFDTKHINHDLAGITDDRGIRELRHHFYKSSKGNVRNNGIKLWPPKEALTIAENDPRFDWYRLYFPK